MVLAVMIMVISVRLTEALFTVEYQEVHTEGIERRHEHASQYRKQGKACAWNMRCMDRFDDRVFGVKTREERRANQRQRT